REVPVEALSLDDALEFGGTSGTAVLVDLKRPRIERAVATSLRRHGLLDRAFVSSTSARSLRRLAAADGDVTRSISYPHDRYRISRVDWPGPLTLGTAAALRPPMPLRVPLLLSGAPARVLAG